MRARTPRSRVVALAALAALVLCACLPSVRPRASYEANPQLIPAGQFVIFQDSTGALSYHAPTGRDVRKLVTTRRVEGRACQRGLQLPFEPLIAAASSAQPYPASIGVGWGDGGYRRALADARRGLPRDSILYDVRADLATQVILSIYRESCLIVNAAVAVPLADAQPVR